MLRCGHRLAAALVVLALGAFGDPCPAYAKSHRSRLAQVSGNADSSIEPIQPMRSIERDGVDPSGSGRRITLDLPLAKRDHVYTIPVNLPSENTVQRSLLSAVRVFAALPAAAVLEQIHPRRLRAAAR